MFEWLTEAFVERWPTKKELEMPDMPRLSVDEGISRAQRNHSAIADMLCKPNFPQWEDPQDMPFTNPTRHRLVRGA